MYIGYIICCALPIVIAIIVYVLRRFVFLLGPISAGMLILLYVGIWAYGSFIYVLPLVNASFISEVKAWVMIGILGISIIIGTGTWMKALTTYLSGDW